MKPSERRLIKTGNRLFFRNVGTFSTTQISNPNILRQILALGAHSATSHTQTTPTITQDSYTTKRDAKSGLATITFTRRRKGGKEKPLDNRTRRSVKELAADMNRQEASQPNLTTVRGGNYGRWIDHISQEGNQGY